MDDRDESMRPKAAREYLGVSRSTIVRYVKNGLLTEYRTGGGHARFLKSDLDKLRTNRPKPGPRPKDTPNVTG
jgi:excisionase family DNA binding protein